MSSFFVSKKIVAVIGDASLDAYNLATQKAIEGLAHDLGSAIIDAGYVLANGGMGGVMECSSKGARSAANYRPNSIISVLPMYDKSAGNGLADICLTSGYDLGRNIALISMADAVVAIGGGAGTLNEITLAWQMGKLIIALGPYGWAGKVASTKLDSRRHDLIYQAASPDEALTIIKENIDAYSAPFRGVNPVMSNKEAEKVISQQFKAEVSFVGKGEEGLVFKGKDSNHYYKVFKFKDQRLNAFLFQHLKVVSSNEQSSKYFFTSPFNVSTDGKHVFVDYSTCGESIALDCYDGRVDMKQFQRLMTEYYYAGIVHSNIREKNLCVDSDGKLFICDIGCDLDCYTEEEFDVMCKQAFSLCLLRDAGIDNGDKVKQVLSSYHRHTDFGLLESVLGIDSLNKEYRAFLNGIAPTTQPGDMIVDFYQHHPEYVSIFDYGAGHADIARRLMEEGSKTVSAYDIDTELVHKYDHNYSQLYEAIGNYAGMKEHILQGHIYDSVLCSLVLCHPLAQTEPERLAVIDGIIDDLCQLSKSHIAVVICNPLSTFSESNVQVRHSLDKMPRNYSDSFMYQKEILSSGRAREDIHRSIGFYEQLFSSHRLTIRRVLQSGDYTSSKYLVMNSDFILFDLVKD